MGTSTLASSTPATAPPRRLARGRVPRVSPTRGGTRGGRDSRVVAGAADPSASLPQALIDAVSKKFEDDVKGVTSLFEETPATYPRPPTLPVAGNTLDIAQGGHEILLEWALEYGNNPAGVHEVQMLGQTILHVVDPKIARELMVAKSDEFPDRGVSAMAKFFREDQAAFVNTSGEQWMAYRKMGTASVNGSALDRLAGKVAERSEALARAWRRKAEAAGRLGGDGALALEIDMDTATQAVTLEVIHEALFSETLDVIDEEPDAVALARSFRRFNEANQDLLNDFLQLYQRFDTPDAHRRETHRRGCARTSTRARTRARRSSRAAGTPRTRRRICSPRCSRRATPPRARA